MDCPCMRFLKSRSFLLAAGLFVGVGALIFAGVAWSSGSREEAEVSGTCAAGSGGTSCQDIHTLLRKKPTEESPTCLPKQAFSPPSPPEGVTCCPASPARPVAAPAVEGIQ